MGTHTATPANPALLAKVSLELDAADEAMSAGDLNQAEMMLENAGEHLAAAGADPTARASYRPPAPGSTVGSGAASGAAAQLIGADEMARYEFLQVKLSVRMNRIAAPQALTRLLRLLQQKNDLRGGRELYAELSKAAYTSRDSSMAHSHPPPAVLPKKD
ncbi:MAG: hypothetical protein RJA70_2658 [Pseudomonadota bacterium]|jgi:hypothetical protein